MAFSFIANKTIKKVLDPNENLVYGETQLACIKLKQIPALHAQINVLWHDNFGQIGQKKLGLQDAVANKTVEKMLTSTKT